MEIAVIMILIRIPEEPEGSLSPHALRIPPVLFPGKPFLMTPKFGERLFLAIASQEDAR